MDIIINLIIFIAGLAIGIFIQKSLSSSTEQSTATEEKLTKREQELTQYKLNVAEHLDDSAALLKKMNETCQVAMAQMEKSTELLQRATPEKSSDELPFFSEEITADLTTTASLRRPAAGNSSDHDLTEAPKDYSDDPSGLFKGEKQTVTNA